MHELSIAISIVEIVEEEARQAGAHAIDKVHLEIGSLSGVMPDALEFAMKEAVIGTSLQNSNIEIDFIQAVAVCEDCCQEFETTDHYKACPFCNSLNTNFIKGKELKIKSIEISQN
jgi:hydrogenase nickel incorporation protein HypA/HybF